VTCTANDGFTAPVTASFIATVGDKTPPSFNIPAPATADATSPRGATVQWAPDVLSDAVTATNDINVTCDGVTKFGNATFSAVFPVGLTTVTCTAQDAAGNVVDPPKAFTVAVEDRTPPAFDDFPGNILIQAGDAAAMHPVTWAAPNATDNYATNINVACTPPSGSLFPVNQQPAAVVTCTATDSVGLSTVRTFEVEVKDNVPPTVVVPASNFDLSAENAAGAAWKETGKPAPSFGASYKDGDATGSASCTIAKPDGSPLVCAQGEQCVFPLGVVAGTAGVSTVNCTGRDANGNSAWATFTVTVKDDKAPNINFTAPGSAVEATSPTGALVSITATALDNVDGAVPVNITVNGQPYDPRTTFLPLVTGGACRGRRAHALPPLPRKAREVVAAAGVHNTHAMLAGSDCQLAQ
jgi:hypothetical protein